MASNILDDLLKLPADERIEIAIALWDSVSDDDYAASDGLTEEQKALLDRRWENLQANPDAAISLDELKRRLRERRGSPHPV